MKNDFANKALYLDQTTLLQMKEVLGIEHIVEEEKGLDEGNHINTLIMQDVESDHEDEIERRKKIDEIIMDKKEERKSIKRPKFLRSKQKVFGLSDNSSMETFSVCRIYLYNVF
jgi:hypothetical protein